eukprot:g16588.t1
MADDGGGYGGRDGEEEEDDGVSFSRFAEIFSDTHPATLSIDVWEVASMFIPV